MCRWLAYSGPVLRLSDLLMRPDHSLIDQSRNARQNVETTNGDGFGVGWYAAEETPALYRDTHPAWNDSNFRYLAEHIHSGLFLSHVRAATGTSVQNTNCHPFSFDNWLFQHNGLVPEFRKLKRQLMFDVDPELFPHIGGSTDSETLFFLALTFGLRDDPPAALSRMIGHVERVREAAGIAQPLYFTACVTDGQRLWAVRYSSINQSRTLYHSRHAHALRYRRDLRDATSRRIDRFVGTVGRTTRSLGPRAGVVTRDRRERHDCRHVVLSGLATIAEQSDSAPDKACNSRQPQG